MPIYEYRCTECGEEFQELILSRADQQNIKCRACGSADVTKLMSGAAVRMGSTPGASCELKQSGACPGGACGCHG